MTALEKSNLMRRLPTRAVRRGLRLDSGLSLGDVARDLRVSKMTIHRWEVNEIRQPKSWPLLKKYVALLEGLRK